MPSLLNIIQYFFDPLPVGPFKYMYFFIVLAALSLIASVALRFYLKKQKEDKIFKKLFKDLPGKIQLFAILEAAYVFVRFERMPYLSMRFLNYCVLAYGIYLAVHYAQLYFKVYPSEKKHREHQLKINKYLPRKHKRS